jgi:hypothetical protein
LQLANRNEREKLGLICSCKQFGGAVVREPLIFVIAGSGIAFTFLSKLRNPKERNGANLMLSRRMIPHSRSRPWGIESQNEIDISVIGFHATRPDTVAPHPPINLVGVTARSMAATKSLEPAPHLETLLRASVNDTSSG